MNVDLFGNIIVEEVVEVPKVKKGNPFELMKAFTSKKYPEDLNGYAPYIVNLAMSQRKDTVHYANELNKYHQLSAKEQFDFYFYALPNRNYFAKWAKAVKSDYTDSIMWYFEVSYKVAKQYEKVLKKEQMDTIKDKYEKRKGGR